MRATTIFDRSRLGSVRVLARTLAEHHPELELVALYVGEDDPPAVEGATTVTLHDVLGDGSWWPSVAMSPVPFRDRALLGAFLRHVGGPVLFLSCALRVTGPLDPLLDALETDDVVLVPLTGGALPDDELRPLAARVAAAGQVSPRVLGVGKGPVAERLLATWPEVDEGESPNRPAELTASLVQRHVDSVAVAGTGVSIVGNPSVALAYWNAPLRLDAAGELADGSRLRLLDCSGLDASVPDIPWPNQDRLRLSRAPWLARLLRTQIAEEAAASAGDSPAPYLTDHRGRLLDAFHRNLLRLAWREGAVHHPPWTEGGLAEWDAWLDEPAAPGQHMSLTRYHLELWNWRSDLQSAYPTLSGPDGTGYAGWLSAYGTRDHEIPLRQLPPAPPSTFAAAEYELPWGVNVAGFFRSELGLGEAARLLITGLDAAAVPALPVQGALVPPIRQMAEFSFSSPDEASFPINIICMNGDSIPHFVRDVDQDFFVGRYTIALWWWEVVDAFPSAWHEAFEHIDEVWVATDLIHDAIAPHSPVPVNKVRMPVTLPRLPTVSRSALGFPEKGFTFFFMYDYHSTSARKNPTGLVEAFKRAFSPGEGAKLVLKCINAERLPEQHERTMLAIGDHPDITVLDRYVSADEKNAMLGACDCYVSLHRSEGFGLTPAEAMLLGKPVIATRYGGVMDFMNDETAYLVDFEWTAIGASAHPYPPEARWAEPDLEQAARHMRAVFEDPEAAREVGARGKQRMVSRHAPAVAGATMRERLQFVYERMSEEAVAGASDRVAPQVHIDRLRRQVETDAHPRGEGTRRKVRHVSDRATSKVLGRPRPVAEDIVSALDGLQQQLHRLESRFQADRAETLAAVRRIRSQLGDHERWSDGLDHHRRRFDRHLDEHRTLPWMAEPFAGWHEDVAGDVEGFREEHAADPARGEREGEPVSAEAYRQFEDRFRGSRGRIVELQRPYAALLAGAAPVLDCGCGRGELLQVLRDAGIAATGVDVDEGMLAVAEGRGFDVRRDDAVAALGATDPGTLGAVTAMQVVEHLTYAELQELLAGARTALRAGGRLVLETVNPHAITSMKGFWLDPTHQHPLFPEVLLELCREAGFVTAYVFHPNGTGDVVVDRHVLPAFAVIATA